MTDQLLNVPGLFNAGNTCFFNAALQSLAAAPTLLLFLQQALLSASESDASAPAAPLQLVAALATCLEGLQPAAGRAGAKHAWPVFDALRRAAHLTAHRRMPGIHNLTLRV